MDSNEKYTIIRLKPNVSSAKILAGFPWVYDNELVLDRDKSFGWTAFKGTSPWSNGFSAMR